MLRYKIRHSLPTILVALFVYSCVGAFGSKWHNDFFGALCLGLFLAAPDYHPNLLQSAARMRGAFGILLDRVLREQSAYDEATSNGLAATARKPTPEETLETEQARKILCRHLALEEMSLVGKSTLKDYLLPGD